jgi:hypothetical protein
LHSGGERFESVKLQIRKAVDSQLRIYGLLFLYTIFYPKCVLINFCGLTLFLTKHEADHCIIISRKRLPRLVATEHLLIALIEFLLAQYLKFCNVLDYHFHILVPMNCIKPLLADSTVPQPVPFDSKANDCKTVSARRAPNRHRMKLLLCTTLGLALPFLVNTSASAADTGAVGLMKIGNLKIDGDLKEWTEIPIIRMANEKYSSTPLQWQGAADCSLDLQYAWNDAGFQIAGRVYDESVVDDDNLQIFLSGNPKDFSPFARNPLKLTFSSPTATRPASIKILNQADPEVAKQISLATKNLTDGYSFEITVPFTLIPNFTTAPNATINAALAINDSDNGRVYPQRVTRHFDPTKQGQLIPFNLVAPNLNQPSLQDFGLFTDLQIPKLVLDWKPRFAFDSASKLVEKDVKFSIEIRKDEKTVASRQLDSTAFKKANGIASAAIEFDLKDLPDGEYIVRTSLSSPRLTTPLQLDNKVDVLVKTKDIVEPTIAKLEAAKLPELVTKEPFRAAAYFGVVGAVEWLKWGIVQKAPHAIAMTGQEIANRLAVLENKELPYKDSQYSLLELTRNPEAQLVVEYMRERSPQYPLNASLAIYWGNLPLVSALADTYNSEQEATNSLKKSAAIPYVKQLEIAGTTIYDVKQTIREPFDIKTLDAGTHFISPISAKEFEVLTVENAALHKPDAIFIFPETNEAAVTNIKAAAEQLNLPIAVASTMRNFKKVLYAGTPDDTTVGKNIKNGKSYTLSISPITGSLFFSKGKTAFTIPYVSLDAARKFASIILAGKPSTVADARNIRQDIIKATGRTPQKLVVPAGMEVFSGDLHSHSFLSDGRPTPLTVSAAELYTNTDLHVLSDHGVFQTGLDYLDTVKKAGFNYPVIIGTELNTRWGHVNIYPMGRDSSFVMGPTIKDVIAQAHKMNAAIQWNHPDTDYSDLPEYLENGLEGSGFHAWEHYPPQYTKWKAAGKLPVLTGGTDTHNGTLHMPERTFLVMPNAEGQTLADTVKSGNSILLDPWNGAYTITRNMINKSRWDDLYFYGPDDKIQFAVNALADENYLKDLKVKRYKEYMKNMDIGAMIRTSSAFDTVK